MSKEESGPLVDGWEISVGNGLSGYGVYAHMTDYPEEGAVLVLALAAPQPAHPTDDALTQALQERDAADDYIDALLDEVLGADRPEWSSAYGRADAIEQVRDRMTALMKPSIDKAFDRFESEMKAQPAQPLCQKQG